MRAVKWARRKPAAAILLLVGGLAAVLLLTAMVVSNVLISRAYTDKEREQQLTQEALDRETRTKEELGQTIDRERRTAYFQAITAAQQAWEAGQVYQAELLLDGCSENLREWEWQYLKRLCQSGATLDVPSPTLHGSGRWILSTRRQRGCWVVTVLEAETGNERYTLRLDRAPNSFSLNWDGNRLAAVVQAGGPNGSNSVKVWDLITGTDTLTLNYPASQLVHVVFTPDDKSLITLAGLEHERVGVVTREMRRWDARSGELQWKKKIPLVRDRVEMSPDGKLIAGVRPGHFSGLFVWNAQTGDEVYHRGSQNGYVIRECAFSPDSRFIALALNLEPFLGPDDPFTPSSRIAIVESSKDQLVHEFSTGLGWIEDLAYSRDGKQLALGGQDASVRMVDASTGQERRVFRGHWGPVAAVAFSPDGKQLLSTSGDTIKRWEASSIQAFRWKRGYDGGSFAPDSKQLVLKLALDPRMSCWDVENWQTARDQLRETQPDVHQVAYAADGRQVAILTIKAVTLKDILTSKRSFRLQIWDRQANRHLRDIAIPQEQPPRGLEHSPDGQFLAVHHLSGQLAIYRTESGEPQYQLDKVHSLAFSPDGHWLTTSGTGEGSQLRHDGHWWTTSTTGDGFALREAATGRVARTFAHLDMNFVTFSPNSQIVAGAIVAGAFADVLFWETASGQPVLKSIEGSRCVAFSPDGQRIATGSQDEPTINIWDAETGKLLLALKRQGQHAFERLAFSPNGAFLAGWTNDYFVVWDATPLPAGLEYKTKAHDRRCRNLPACPPLCRSRLPPGTREWIVPEHTRRGPVSVRQIPGSRADPSPFGPTQSQAGPSAIGRPGVPGHGVSSSRPGQGGTDLLGSATPTGEGQSIPRESGLLEGGRSLVECGRSIEKMTDDSHGKWS
jgi:WD40 repeat protein